MVVCVHSHFAQRNIQLEQRYVQCGRQQQKHGKRVLTQLGLEKVHGPARMEEGLADVQEPESYIDEFHGRR